MLLQQLFGIGAGLQPLDQHHGGQRELASHISRKFQKSAEGVLGFAHLQLLLGLQLRNSRQRQLQHCAGGALAAALHTGSRIAALFILQAHRHCQNHIFAFIRKARIFQRSARVFLGRVQLLPAFGAGRLLQHLRRPGHIHALGAPAYQQPSLNILQQAVTAGAHPLGTPFSGGILHLPQHTFLYFPMGCRQVLPVQQDPAFSRTAPGFVVLPAGKGIPVGCLPHIAIF